MSVSGSWTALLHAPLRSKETDGKDPTVRNGYFL